MTQLDKAGTAHWENVWDGMPLLPRIKPKDLGVRNYMTRQYHDFFDHAIRTWERRPLNIIELGCGHSVWLPYFYNEYRLDPWGLDYTEIGCESSRAALVRDGVRNDQIIRGNIFDPHPDLAEKFDVVYSSGLVEHSEDTVRAIRACAKFLKPGGRLITVIPNMMGLTGWLQKTLCPRIYSKHVPLDLSKLQSAHWNAGLREVFSRHLGVFNFWVLNLNDRSKTFRQIAFKLGGAASLGLGILHDLYIPLIRPNKYTSPSIGCVFTKPE